MNVLSECVGKYVSDFLGSAGWAECDVKYFHGCVTFLWGYRIYYTKCGESVKVGEEDFMKGEETEKKLKSKYGLLDMYFVILSLTNDRVFLRAERKENDR